MSNAPSILLCTVGTSLFNPNLNKLTTPDDYESRLSEPDRQTLQRAGLLKDSAVLNNIVMEVITAYRQQDYTRLARHLNRLPPDLRLLGAEINSTDAMQRKHFIGSRQRIILLVSDTEEGQAIGTILKQYFTSPGGAIAFETADMIPVTGLQDEQPLVFQREGLTCLVRLMGEELRKWGPQNLAINATGGYKAQIALAVAFGQATRCPVFYKHERFDQIIRFPRIPFTMDLSMVANHLKVWADLAEPDAVFDAAALDEKLGPAPDLREAILPMLDSVTDEGTVYYSLSALGMVYWEAFLAQHPQSVLQPAAVTRRLGCRFRDDHYPADFKAYVEKVYEAHPDLISVCHSMDYSGQAAIKGNRFLVRGKDIVGEYVDRRNFGARFRIQTPATNMLEREWVVARLNNWK